MEFIPTARYGYPLHTFNTSTNMYVRPNTQKPTPDVMAIKLVFHLFLLIGMYPSNCLNPHNSPAASRRETPISK